MGEKVNRFERGILFLLYADEDISTTKGDWFMHVYIVSMVMSTGGLSPTHLCEQ